MGNMDNDVRLIIQSAMNKDEQAFETLYNLYWKRIYFIAFQYVKEEAKANDIAQETFIKVFKKISTLKEPEAFNSWIYRIAYRECLNHNRSKVQLTSFPEEFTADDIEDPQKTYVVETMSQEELKKLVIESLENLSPKFKEVGYLSFFEEMKNAEIAKILNLPRGTVASRLLKIRTIVQNDLRKNGVNVNANSVTILITPLLYEAYKTLLDRSSETPLLPSDLFSQIAQSGEAVAGMTLLSKTLVTLLVGGVATFATITSLYFFNQDKTEPTEEPAPIVEKEKPSPAPSMEYSKIEDIKYDTSWTNTFVELEVITTNDNYDTIKINDVATLEVHENGTYTVSLIKDDKIIDKREVVIQNIDRFSPTGTSQNNGTIFTLTLNDDVSGIDPNSIQMIRDGVISYDYSYTNNVITVNSPYPLHDVFYVRDYAGNLLEIEIK